MHKKSYKSLIKRQHIGKMGKTLEQAIQKRRYTNDQ